MHCEFLAASWSEEAYGLAWATVCFALIFGLLAAAVTLAKRYREHKSLWKNLNDRSADDTGDPSQLLTKFRDLHSRGTLSDAEYRSIKSKLASQIHGGLSPSEDLPPKATKPTDSQDNSGKKSDET